MPLQSLIDKKDSFELVRDSIAAILATEAASQKALATAGGKNPALWDFKVYLERSNPIDNFATESDLTPVVSVSYEQGDFDGMKSDMIETQSHIATYNIDCYASGKSGDSGSGHVNGDQIANEAVQRIARLVRNILMSPAYYWLNLKGTVGSRRITRIAIQQASKGHDSTINVAVARVVLQVRMTETSQQYTGQPLEYTSVVINNGEVQVDLDYNT
jgi:hypothetical protein